jgi:hypothetical protein
LNRLEAIKARLALATAGPWTFINRPDSIPCTNRIESESGFVCKGAADISCCSISQADGDFIASAKSDIDYLIKEYETLLVKYDEVVKNHTLVINLRELPDD